MMIATIRQGQKWYNKEKEAREDDILRNNNMIVVIQKS